MGTWSASPFGNDSAIDWVAELVGHGDARALILNTLSGTRSGAWDAPEAEEAIAAAAVVAAAGTEPIGPVIGDVKNWISVSGFAPDVALVEHGLRTIAAVRDDSELRSLWEEAGKLKNWLAQLAKLTAQLERARTAGVAKRTPKAPRASRKLAGLLKAYVAKPSAATRSLVRAGFAALADPNAANAATDFETPLALAARHGLLEESLCLLARGANPNAGSKSPFVEACVAGHLDIAQALFEAGATVFHEHRFSPELGISRSVAVTDPRAPLQGHRYCQAMFAVARKGPAKAADFLLSVGAEVRQTDLNGETLLHKAAESGCLEMMAYLLDRGIDVNVVKGRSGDSALHYAARAGEAAAVTYLLERGANPNLIAKSEVEPPDWRESPLDVAKGPEVKRALMAVGARSADEM